MTRKAECSAVACHWTPAIRKERKIILKERYERKQLREVVDNALLIKTD